MSTYAGQLESASTLPAERVLERRLTRYLIGDRRALDRRRSLRSGRHERPPGRSACIRAAYRRRNHRHGRGCDRLGCSAPRKSYGSHPAGLGGRLCRDLFRELRRRYSTASACCSTRHLHPGVLRSFRLPTRPLKPSRQAPGRRTSAGLGPSNSALVPLLALRQRRRASGPLKRCVPDECADDRRTALDRSGVWSGRG